MTDVFIRIFPFNEIVKHIQSISVPRKGEFFIFENIEYEVWSVTWELRLDELICFLTLTEPLERILYAQKRLAIP